MLLLDVSGSMSRLLGDMSAKASDALRQLHPGDQVAVMVFASKTEIVLPFTADLKKVPEAIVMNVFKTTSGRETYLNEAILAAAGYLKDQPGAGRKAILVVTDNEGVAAAAKDMRRPSIAAQRRRSLQRDSSGRQQRNRAARPGPYSDPASAQPDVYRFVQNTGGDVIADDDAGNALAGSCGRSRHGYNFQYPHRRKVSPAPSAVSGSNSRPGPAPLPGPLCRRAPAITSTSSNSGLRRVVQPAPQLLTELIQLFGRTAELTEDAVRHCERYLSLTREDLIRTGTPQ